MSPNEEIPPSFDEDPAYFYARLSVIDCPCSRELLERLMNKAKHFRILAYHASLRKDPSAESALNIASDEINILIEEFMDESDAARKEEGEMPEGHQHAPNN